VPYGSKRDEYRLHNDSDLYWYKSLPGARRAVDRVRDAVILVVDTEQMDRVFAHGEESLQARWELAEANMMRWGARTRELENQIRQTVGEKPDDFNPILATSPLTLAAARFHRAECTRDACYAARQAMTGLAPKSGHIPTCPLYRAHNALLAECAKASALYGTDVPL
jgi:hypothetical protein